MQANSEIEVSTQACGASRKFILKYLYIFTIYKNKTVNIAQDFITKTYNIFTVVHDLSALSDACSTFPDLLCGVSALIQGYFVVSYTMTLSFVELCWYNCLLCCEEP